MCALIGQLCKGFIQSWSASVYCHLFVRNLPLTSGYSVLIFTQNLVKDESDCRLHRLAQVSISKVIETPDYAFPICAWIHNTNNSWYMYVQLHCSQNVHAFHKVVISGVFFGFKLFKRMLTLQHATVELWMPLGGLLSIYDPLTMLLRWMFTIS